MPVGRYVIRHGGSVLFTCSRPRRSSGTCERAVQAFVDLDRFVIAKATTTWANTLSGDCTKSNDEQEHTAVEHTLAFSVPYTYSP